MVRDLHLDLGVGVEYTPDLEDALQADLPQQEVLEIIPENFFNDRRKSFLRALGESQLPVVIHGVDLSLGSAGHFKQRHFDEYRRIAGEVNTAIVSEHLCMTEAGGVELGQLCPLPWTLEACDNVCRHIERVQRAFDVPFMIENIANRFILPGAEMTETQFINRVLRTTGCYLLLDLQNVYVNSINFGFDAEQWLSEIDLDRALGIHLAGGYYDEDGFLQDGHSHPIMSPVWELYRKFCRDRQPAVTIIERTSSVPSLTELEKEVAAARRIRNNSFSAVRARRAAVAGAVS